MISLVIAVIGGGWALFDYGRERAGFDNNLAKREAALLRERIEGLLGENSELRGQNAILTQAAEIDRQAYAEVDESLKGLQNEILELKQEVDFYRGIVSPSGGDGLRVQEFSISRTGESQNYRYTLVVSQFANKQRLIKGYVKVTIYGMQDMEQKQLEFKDVSSSGHNSIAFRFRFFQKFEGDIKLPENFEPLRIEVTAISQSKGVKDIEKVFNWPELVV